MSENTCVAYRDDGTLCRRPAVAVDRQRGGIVCAEHLPRCAVCGEPTTNWSFDQERHLCPRCLPVPAGRVSWYEQSRDTHADAAERG